MLTTQKVLARSKDYKMLLGGQVITLVNNVIVYELFRRYPFPGYEQVFVALMGTISLGMNVIAYLLLKDLSDSRFVRRSVIALLFVGILAGLASASLGTSSSNSLYLKMLMLLSVGSVFIAFCVLLYLMLYDIFNEKHDIIYRLWGAASIYVLIGVLFASFYFLVEILFPQEFGGTGIPDPFHFVKCYTFSFYTLSGIDQPFEDLSLLVKNISVIQAVFSNLYIMLLVGRLLSK